MAAGHRTQIEEEATAIQYRAYLFDFPPLKKKKEKKNPFIFPLDRKKTSLPWRPFYPRQVTCRQLFIKQKSGFSVAQVQVYIPSLPLLSLHILE